MEDNVKDKKVRERIYMTREQLNQLEIDIFDRRHVERYAMIRQWMYGNVLDISCGCGYGTYLLSKNPDVDKIVGVDVSTHAIDHAKENFTTSKCTFEVNSIEQYDTPADILVSLETAEHLEDPQILNELAERIGAKYIFVSYPSKKTTHYNKHHYHDFIDEDLIRVFSGYRLVDSIDLHREHRILKFEQY